MGIKTLKLEISNKETKVIRVTDRTKSVTYTIPDLYVVDGIQIFTSILCNTITDWDQTCSSYPKVEKHDDKYIEIYVAVRPIFIRCMFTYIMFFFMLENGYLNVFHSLEKINSELGFKLKYELPEPDEYIRSRLKLVRNKSVAHWADISPDRRNDINTKAGIFLNLATRWDKNGLIDIATMEFGHLILEGAEDRTLKSLTDTDEICSQYIQKLDDVCFSYLKEVKTKLPFVTDNIKYEIQ